MQIVFCRTTRDVTASRSFASSGFNIHDQHTSTLARSLTNRCHAEDGSMAVHPTYTNSSAPIGAPESDYGSDIDDATADELFSQAESQVALKETAVKGTIVAEQRIVAELEQDVYTHNHSVRLARQRQLHPNVLESGIPELEAIEAPRRRRWSRDANIEVEYDERNRGAFSRGSIVSGIAGRRLTADRSAPYSLECRRRDSDT